MLTEVYHTLPFTDEHVHLLAERKLLIFYLVYLSYASTSQSQNQSSSDCLLRLLSMTATLSPYTPLLQSPLIHGKQASSAVSVYNMSRVSDTVSTQDF